MKNTLLAWTLLDPRYKMWVKLECGMSVVDSVLCLSISELEAKLHSLLEQIDAMSNSIILGINSKETDLDTYVAWCKFNYERCLVEKLIEYTYDDCKMVA